MQYGVEHAKFVPVIIPFSISHTELWLFVYFFVSFLTVRSLKAWTALFYFLSLAHSVV